jgi:hypothetical protein
MMSSCRIKCINLCVTACHADKIVDNKQCVYKSVVDLYNFTLALHLHNFFFIVNQGLEKVFSVSEGCCMIMLWECLVLFEQFINYYVNVRSSFSTYYMLDLMLC